MNSDSLCTFRGVQRANPFCLDLACRDDRSAIFLTGRSIDGEFIIQSSSTAVKSVPVVIVRIEVHHVGQLDTALYPPVEIEMLSEHEGVLRSALP